MRGDYLTYNIRTMANFFSRLFGKGEDKDQIIHSLEQQLAERATELSQREAQIATLNETQLHLQESQKQSEQAQQARISELSNQLHNLQEQLATRTKDLSEQTQKLQETESALQHILSGNQLPAHIAEQLAKPSKATLEEIAQLQAQASALQSQLTEAQEALQQSQANYAKEASELRQAQEQAQQEASALQATIESLQAELKKAKDEVEDLEEELEEAQDKLEEAQKNLKKERRKLEEKKTEIKDLAKQVDNLKQEEQESKDKIWNLNLEIENVRDQAGKRRQALDFVKEVLTAKVTGEDAELRQKVQELADFIRSDAFREHITLTEVGEANLRMWQSEITKSWIRGKVKIAFIGEFSAGKTSIVNRLLSENNPKALQLPTSAMPTTAIPTYISGRRGGGGATYRFYTPDSTLKEVSENTFRKVNKEVLEEVGGVASMIKYFVMAYANPALEHLSILDTPGFSSQDKEDEERTMEVINECDALFWVVDVNSGTINNRSLKIIKKYLQKPLYIVINKVDSKAATEVDAVEHTIRQNFANAQCPFQGILRMGYKTPLNKMHQVFSSLGSYTNNELIEELSQTLRNQYYELGNTLGNRRNSLSQKKCELKELETTFSTNLDTMKEIAEEAAEIPHWETHLFGSNRYEMEEYEFEELKSKLDILSEQAPEILTGNVEGIKELVEDIVKHEETIGQIKTDIQKKLAIQSRFEELVNKIDELSQK